MKKHLGTYRKKRSFQRSPEPPGEVRRSESGRIFAVQKHHARRLHYDFRLEHEGVLKSWAVPKGPSLDPRERRLAVEVEDHPLDYAEFEGEIPPGEYGAGTVLLWDRGQWIPEGDPAAAFQQGTLKFRLQGERLKGRWTLVRMRGKAAGDSGKNWLLIKERDEEARSLEDGDILEQCPESILRGEGPVRQGTRKGKGSSTDPGKIKGARRGSLPRVLKPQLATAVKEPPPGEEWIHEIKFDGYRLLCWIEGESVRFITRQGNDWTDQFPALARAALELPAAEALLDGELVALDENGVSRFGSLQDAMSRGREVDLVYHCFDLLHLDGHDLREAPLLERKKALESLLAASGPRIRYTDHVEGQGDAFFREAEKYGLEGVVSKLGDGAYRSRRTRSWLKVKCLKRHEFVVGGFTAPRGSRTGFGALLLGIHDRKRKLHYAGRVGSGFTEESLRELQVQLERLEQKDSPFANPPASTGSSRIRWTRPELVVEVEFAGRTAEGLLRHPTFRGLAKKGRRGRKS